MERTLRAAYYVFLGAGILGLAYTGWAVLDLYWYQRVETSAFESARGVPPPAPTGAAAAASAVTDPAAAEADAEPVPRSVAPTVLRDGVIGELEVPSVGLKAIVVQGESRRDLQRAVGHVVGTALPGESGNVALAGHRDGLFRPLRNVQPGDSITLRTASREFRYRVEWVAVVPPDASGVIAPTPEHALTLVTCFPFSYIGAAPKRFIVRAREITAEAGGAEPQSSGQ